MSAGSRPIADRSPPEAAVLATAPGLPPALLDMALAAPPGDEAPRRPAGPDRLSEFLAAGSPPEALRLWLQWTGAATAGQRPQRRAVLRGLAQAVAQIDQLLSAQVNAILHHPRFQRLEAAWRGLQHLAGALEETADVKIRVLTVSQKELARDLDRAIEFDQSNIFRKIYENEFGTPGGEPYGVLLGDYEFTHDPQDVRLLVQMSGVAAAAFCPFIAAAGPGLFGIERFADLERPLNLPRTFEQLEYLKWRALRESEDARFLGLTVPRVLMRLPYEDDGAHCHQFMFREDVAGPGDGRHLWGNAAFAFGGVLIRTFAREGWLASIRGVKPGREEGGLVTALPVPSLATDKPGVALKPATDVMITDVQEQELSELGVIPLCPCPDTPWAAFYTTHSVQKPKAYDDPAATANARISAVLQYMFCAARFAHYLKVIVRDKVGALTDAAACEDLLHRWLHQYVVADSEASNETKAEFPLREARVRVLPQPGKPGTYRCTLYLTPHYELEELTATVRLTTELAEGK